MSDNYGSPFPGPPTNPDVWRPVPPHHPTVTSGATPPPGGPPRWDPRDGYSGGPVPPHGPQGPGVSWAGFPLPPEDRGPPGPAPAPAHLMMPDRRPAPAPSAGGPPVLLVLGSVVLALLLGVGATLLYVQPWAQASSRVSEAQVPSTSDNGQFTQPQGGGVTPFAPESSTAAPDPGAELSRIAAGDQPAVDAIPEGYWVPQVSSKRVGLVADGIVYDDAAILSDHEQLRSRYGAVLVRSGDYSTFDNPDFWVTIVASQVSSSSADANRWCDDQGIPRDDCFAKRIGHGAYDTSTKHR